jgi:hypothetical protein
MDDKKKDCPYEEVTGRIETIDVNLKTIRERLKVIELMVEKHKDKQIEICEDEIESENALQDALDNYFIDELMKAKPAGEA